MAEPEHLDVLIIGAGLSGVGAAHYVATECPWATYAVLEGRQDMGGTWDLFRYPGIRSDSDMFTLGYSFRPWRGEKSISDGASILQYIKDTAAEDGTDRHIRFGHRVTRAAWSTDEARWHVTAERVGPDGEPTGEAVELTCTFLFSCTGYYRYDHGYEPEFAGIEDFQGTVVHPQHWPEDLDYAGKRVVVIGSGATAVTLVPAMAADAAHVTMLQRSPTWMASLPARDPLADAVRGALPERVSAPAIRWYKALSTQASYRFSKRRPEWMKRVLLKMVAQQLPDDYDVATHFTPRYDPWDQRLCAVTDGDLFRGIRDGSVSVVTDTIDTFTPDGIRLSSGEELVADVVVTATGLELLFMGGIDVTVDGEPVDPAGRLSFRGMMLDGVPNLAFAIGYTNASWTLKAEITCRYVARLLNHLHATGLRQATPRSTATSSTGEPLLGLNAGYIQRAADKLPSQGTRDPWIVHQSYLRDQRAWRRSEVVDDDLVLSNPAPAGEGGRVAAVTGAGSGIGRALAVELARRGTHVAVCDVDDAGLAETVALCEGHGVKVTSAHVDVADRDAVFAWADAVVAEHGAVHLVVNNAGVALGAPAGSMSAEDLRWLMDINFWGVVNGTQAFLPHLEASASGAPAGACHIVNVSSVFGLVPIPTQSAYNASKYAVRGYTEALRMELELAGSPVSATVVHPGGIRTNIVRNARVAEDLSDVAGTEDERAGQFDRIARTTPEQAARVILGAVDRNERRVLVGPDARVFDLLSRLPAGVQQRLITAAARRRT